MKKRIGIIGGGIAGLGLALALRNSDFECLVFEKSPEFKEIGAAISMFPNALRVLNAMGLLEEVLSYSGVMTHVYLKTAKGKILAKANPQYDFPTVCLHRADLLQVLYRNTTAHCFTSHTLESITTLPNGTLKLHFHNQASQIVDAVVGADGIHSAVRKHVVNDGEPIFRGYNIWRGISTYEMGPGYGSETYGKGKRVGIVPIRNGQYAWWATFNEPFLKDDEPEGAHARLKDLFGDWHDPVPQLIANTPSILKNSLIDRKPTRGWSKGMVVLVGDAAHPTTPNLGQGGCIALEGIWILAACIKKYGLTEQAFKAYEKHHFARAKDVNQTSLNLGKMGQLENALLIAMRNALFVLTPDSLNLKMMDRFFARDVVRMEV